MTEEFFDAGLEAKKKANAQYDNYLENARAASETGRLKLVSESVCEPFRGHWFELDKGQV